VNASNHDTRSQPLVAAVAPAVAAAVELTAAPEGNPEEYAVYAQIYIYIHTHIYKYTYT